MRILVTGGHITPAITLLQYLTSTQDKVQLVGRQYVSQDEASISYEASEVESLGFNFIPLESVKFNRHQKLKSLLKSPQFLKSINSARKIIHNFKPDVVVGFGGYTSVPVALAAKSKSVPIVIHEQTTGAGLANQIIGRFATTVALTHASSQVFFQPEKTTVIGNLIRQEFLTKPEIPSWVDLLTHKPIIYVTGGNQGSLIINQTVAQLYPKLLSSFQIIHQSGDSTKHQKYETLVSIRDQLKSDLQSSLLIKRFFPSHHVAWIMNHARLIITRSGANTVTEIMHMAIPSILIPLPTAQQQEQLKNAQLLSNVNAGIIIDQSELNPTTLYKTISQIETNRSSYLIQAQKLSANINQHASQDLYQLIQRALS